MSAIVLKQGVLHYEAMGRGSQSLVFLHGWLGSWRYWVPAMEELSTTRRTYAFDMWGFGDSEKHHDYACGAYVDLLQAFLDEMGVRRAALVGHSLGGLVALRFAARSPDRVKAVMGVSVPLMETSMDRSFVGFSRNGDGLTRLIARQASFPEVEREARKADLNAIASSVRWAIDSDLRQLSLPPSVPVLLVHGAEDTLIEAPRPAWLREVSESSRVVFLDGARHFPMLESKNKFNRLVMAFLRAGGDLDSVELKEEWRRRLR